MMPNSKDKMTLQSMFERYLNHMLQRGDSEKTVKVRRRYLRYFNNWAEPRGLTEPQEIQRHDIDAYQKYLHDYRKEDNEPLSWGSQKR